LTPLILLEKEFILITYNYLLIKIWETIKHILVKKKKNLQKIILKVCIEQTNFSKRLYKETKEVKDYFSKSNLLPKTHERTQG